MKFLAQFMLFSFQGSFDEPSHCEDSPEIEIPATSGAPYQNPLAKMAYGKNDVLAFIRYYLKERKILFLFSLKTTIQNENITK